MKQATIATKEPIAGVQRKLAWFKLHPRGLYFDTGSSIDGSHWSYHVDGNVFRTSPATRNRAKPSGAILPIKSFRGWHQFSIAMVDKSHLPYNSPLRKRDRNRTKQLAEIDVEALPADCLNFVVDVLHQNDMELLEQAGLQVPTDAVEVKFQVDELVLLITILGHHHNLLVRPND